MSVGLYSMATIAKWLRKKEREMDLLIQEDELPVINVPTKQGKRPKVSLSAFHRWIAKRSVNSVIPIDDLEKELDRAAAQKQVVTEAEEVAEAA